MMIHCLKQCVALGLLLLAAGGAVAQLKSGDNPDASENWIKVRNSLFTDRRIETASEEVLTLDVPQRAEDAAVVPVAIRSRLAAGDKRHIARLYLIIDNNPSPIAAIFDFAPASGRADIETRVRVDEYSHVRAVAELADGRLLMATRFVKASGGCSAPPGKDPQAAQASLGRMRLNVDGTARRGESVLAQLMISHPNSSGMAMDQATRQYTPAHYVRRVAVTYAGEPVLTADLDFAISENPNFRFWFVPRGDGELKAEVLDTRELRFESSLALAPVR
jgi:sulfur-oxidizing protein SoxY